MISSANLLNTTHCVAPTHPIMAKATTNLKDKDRNPVPIQVTPNFLLLAKFLFSPRKRKPSPHVIPPCGPASHPGKKVGNVRRMARANLWSGGFMRFFSAARGQQPRFLLPRHAVAPLLARSRGSPHRRVLGISHCRGRCTSCWRVTA
jgi:hypothetical protein